MNLTDQLSSAVRSRLPENLHSGMITTISPLYGAARSLAALALQKEFRHIILLCADTKQVMETEVELVLLGARENVVAVTQYSPEGIQERLTEISKRDKVILIATYQILTLPVPKKKTLADKLIKIQTGASVRYDELLEYLNLFSYQQEQFAEEPGTYAKRGAIIDFWSYSERTPARLEFDGDFIESIRYFDPESQRSIDQADEATLSPRMEIQINDDETACGIFDHLDDPLVLLNRSDAYQFTGEAEYHRDDIKEIFDDEFDDDDEELDIPPDAKPAEELAPRSEFADLLDPIIQQHQNVRWLIEQTLGEDAGRLNLGISEAPPIHSNYKLLFAAINEFIGKGYSVIVGMENELQANRFRALLEEPQNGVDQFLDSGELRTAVLPVKNGFINSAAKILLLTDYQIFNKPYRTKLPAMKKKTQAKSRKLDSIRLGDFVVHEEFGIGKYLGLEAIKIGDADQESMKIRYNEGGIVYVNLNYLHLVKKFSAKEGLTPQLSTLGSNDWSNKKRKAKKKIKEAAKELITLYAKRKMSDGFRFGEDTVWQKELEASFMYEDTVDQARVNEEVKSDMEAQFPMDRLVCGDVGFGKTEIAVRAAFKAVQDGKQAAILVPTTILAEQHFNTFKDRLEQFPVTIDALSRFRSKKEQQEIIARLKEGKVDIIVGTHRLLSKDISFKDLGLLIIDEEHRFGVSAKEKLRSYKSNVDILTLTATPIPRTLNLSLLGARDLSLLSTPPPNRQPIYTRVESFEQAQARQWVLNEMRRGGQIYIVHDRIQTIERFAAYIKRQAPEAKIAVAHGRMKPHQLEDVFHKFLHKEYDVLLATKIIESGLDIPNVNTIIVNRADRFGLAELHQLRGRVGRADRQAYAYFLVPTTKGLNKLTARRLEAIEEHSELGAGFQLAMRDLEIRGAGNLLGTEQTGFINEIGFELYLKLIDQAVDELKQEEFKELFKDLPHAEKRSETTIETFFELGIPHAYIPDQADRLSYYTALYNIKTVDELSEIEEEMKDRFGTMPMLVKRLLQSALVKYYSSSAFFERVIIQPKRIIIILPKAGDNEFYQKWFLKLADLISKEYKDSVHFVQKGDSLKLHIPHTFNVPEAIFEFLAGFSRTVSELYQ